MHSPYFISFLLCSHLKGYKGSGPNSSMATVFAIFALVLLTPSLGAMNIFNTTEEAEADFSERLDALEAIVAEMMSKTENDSKLTEREDKDVYVSTKYGKIKGLTFTTPEKERYDVFYGIPYARPPTGNHRFSQPRPLSPWFPDVKDATQLGNICMQQNTNKFNIATASEDCLNLNIFAPR
ncbi:hypothetical protein RRG08_014835 [Elysia crispata]|uniref:Carboxylesterase type B domain-containing protein n=1 Tax=Elysia crispata TaxID=231223 RepID=A0AAE0Z6X2_9GAST|nr:hypothetical protein RRG08_014835 [Elysia crispata]